jgi:hypothetical protein
MYTSSSVLLVEEMATAMKNIGNGLFAFVFCTMPRWREFQGGDLLARLLREKFHQGTIGRKQHFFKVFFLLAALPLQRGFSTDGGGILVGVFRPLPDANNLAYDVGHWHVFLRETRLFLLPFSPRGFFAGGTPGASSPV